MNLQEEIKALTQRAVDVWFYRWKREHAQQIEEMLDRSAHEIVATLLGMSNRWDRWEVDTSRMKESIVGMYILKHSALCVQHWLDKLFAGGLPEPTAADTAAARKSYEETFKNSVKHAMHQKATRDAEKYLSRIAESVMGEVALDLPAEVALEDSLQRLAKDPS